MRIVSVVGLSGGRRSLLSLTAVERCHEARRTGRARSLVWEHTLLLRRAHLLYAVEILLRVTSNLRPRPGRYKVFDSLPVLPEELQT